MSDHELLRHYTTANSQAAFASLVERHIHFVYSVAIRHVRSPQLAEEVAQSVFFDLARQASRHPADQPLAGWLFTVTRRTAIDTVRREQRRQTREQAAVEIAAMKTPASTWSQTKDRIDEALEALSESERTALLLRFFESRSLREVGQSLGISEDTAQKRVSRALDRLRDLLLQRGVAVTAAGLAADLSAHAIQLAPPGLAAAISGASALAIPAATASATKLTMTLLQKTLLTTGAVLALGGAIFETQALRAQRANLAAVRQQVDALAAETRQTQQQRDLALRQTDEINRRLATFAVSVKTPADLAMEAEMAAWLARVAHLKQLHAERPDLSIPELSRLPETRWFEAARTMRVDNETRLRSTFSQLRTSAEILLIDQLRQALRLYLDAHGGQLPTETRELAALFEPPIDPAMLDRYRMVARGHINDHRSSTLIEEHSPLDFTRDSTWDIRLIGNSSQSGLRFFTLRAIQEFSRTNNGAAPTTPEQLLPYLPGPVEPARLKQFLTPGP